MSNRKALLEAAILYAAYKFSPTDSPKRVLEYWSLFRTEKYGIIPCMSTAVQNRITEICPYWTWPEITEAYHKVLKLVSDTKET